MDKPFAAYRGIEPYVFLCYAHEDAETVYLQIQWLHERGVNIWYDEGIAPGHEWTEELANSIQGASHVLYFISPSSAASRNCRNEIQYATARDKQIIAVHLEPTQLPGGLELTIGLTQAIHKYGMSEADFKAKLASALSVSATPFTEAAKSAPYRSSQRRWFPIAAALATILIVSAAGVWWYWQENTIQEVVAVSATDPAAPLTAIAVMPFDDLSPNRDQEWLAQGMADELLEALSRIEGLWMPSSNSTGALKDLNLDLAAIGKRLNVGTAVVGSIRRSDDQINVLAQWIRIDDEARLWSARYERSLADVFEIQQEIAIGIAEAIRTELGIRDTATFLSQHRYATSDVRAWELVRRALDLVVTFDPEKIGEAREMLKQALEIDPNYTEALAILAFTDFEDQERQVAGALHVLELDPMNGTAHQILITDSMAHWDFETAERLLDRAVGANPQSNTLMFNAVNLYSSSGRLEKALEAAKRGARLDPLWAAHHVELGQTHFDLANYSAAIESFEAGYSALRETGQGLPGSLRYPHAAAYWRGGRETDALATMVRDWPDFEQLIRDAWEANGWHGANLAIGEAIQGDPGRDWLQLWFWARGGDEERMYATLDRWLESTKTDKQRRWVLARMLKSEGDFDDYRRQPRFQALIERIDQHIADGAGTYEHVQ